MYREERKANRCSSLDSQPIRLNQKLLGSVKEPISKRESYGERHLLSTSVFHRHAYMCTHIHLYTHVIPTPHTYTHKTNILTCLIVRDARKIQN